MTNLSFKYPSTKRSRMHLSYDRDDFSVEKNIDGYSFSDLANTRMNLENKLTK